MSTHQSRLELTQERLRMEELQRHNKLVYGRREARNIAQAGYLIGCNESDSFAYARIHARVLNGLHDAEPQHR